MKRLFALWILAAIANGCAHKWQDLKKPGREQYFLLEKD